MMEDSVYTYCRTCASSCGLEVVVDRAANRVVDIKPDRANPFSWQDFCRKGGRGWHSGARMIAIGVTPGADQQDGHRGHRSAASQGNGS